MLLRALVSFLPLLPFSFAQIITGHIIPHSHCDPGWLETFEGYYQSQVNRILSSVVDTLGADASRRFVWAESSFLMRWYEVQSEERRERFRGLVSSGQLEFVGGGWVQSDEANPDYAAIISQLTEGHEYLAQLFGKRPRIAWQIDPFGHASATAAIAAAAGYEALVINRIDHSIKDSLKARGALEFLWTPFAHSPNATILTHVLHTHYSAPKGYDFENPEGWPVTEASGRAAGLVSEIRGRARAYRSSHLLVPFGDDFKFQDANGQFSNMDKLVKYINTGGADGGPAFPGFAIRYSTLSEYFDAVAGELVGGGSSRAPLAASAALPRYYPNSTFDSGVDFFPYADNVNSYWTGYYVSRPALKNAIRRTTALLRSADAFLALARPSAEVWAAAAAAAPSLSTAPYAAFSWLAAFQRLEQVRLDAALCLHHDAITGTSRDNVVSDYADKLAAGGEDVLGVLTDIASLQLGSKGLLEEEAAAAGPGQHLPQAMPAPLTQVLHVLPVEPAFPPALLSLVASAAHPKRSPLGKASGEVPGHPVVLYNPSGWERAHLGSVLVDVGSSSSSASANECGAGKRWPIAIVVDSSGNVVPSQWLATLESADSGAMDDARAKAKAFEALSLPLLSDWEPLNAGGPWASTGVRYELVWSAQLPPMSLTTFFVSVAWGQGGADAEYGGGAGDGGGQGAACPPPAPPSPTTAMHTSCAILVPPSLLAGPPAAAPAGAPAVAEGIGGQRRPQKARVGGVRKLLQGQGGGGEGEKGGQLMQLQPPPLLAAPAPAPPITLDNACLALGVDATTGLLVTVARKLSGGGRVAIPFKQAYAAYHTRASGAYIFRPLDDARAWDQGTSSAVSVTYAEEEGVGREPLVRSVRVLGPEWSHSIRLTNIGGSSGRGGEEEGGASAVPDYCADPTHPDAGFEVVPTVSAGGNQEVVMQVTMGLALQGEDAPSTNLRDVFSRNSLWVQPAEDTAPAAEDSVCIPFGWWTSDGMGLIRRTPAQSGLSGDQHQKHFYPLNTLTRVSGLVVPQSSAEAQQEKGGVAWVSLHTAQPFGVFVEREPGDTGIRMEVMLHRHLSQDDGRGLSTGVFDTTVLTPSLRFAVGAQAAEAVSAGAGSKKPRLTCAGQPGVKHAAAGAAVLEEGQQQGRLHDDWEWKWATSSVAHTQPVIAFQADLAPLLQAASKDSPPAPPVSKEQQRPPAPHTSPPLDPLTALGVRRVTALAESPGIPREVWLARFWGEWSGLAAPLPLPMHLLTLQARDAVTDDTVLRIHYFSPRAAPQALNLATQLFDPEVVQLTSLSPRSLTLNRAMDPSTLKPAGTPSALARLALLPRPPDNAEEALACTNLVTLMTTSTEVVWASLEKAKAALGIKGLEGGGGAGVGSRQNTEEEGVFISDAAVKAAALGGRNLLEAVPGQVGKGARALSNAAAPKAAPALLGAMAEALSSPVTGLSGTFLTAAPSSISSFLLTLKTTRRAPKASSPAGRRGGSIKPPPAAPAAELPAAPLLGQPDAALAAAPAAAAAAARGADPSFEPPVAISAVREGRGGMLDGSDEEDSAGSPIALPSLTHFQSQAATLELIECLDLPPLRTLKLREAASSPMSIGAQEKQWLLKLARRAISHAEHSSGETGEGQFLESFEQAVASLAPLDRFSTPSWKTLGKQGALLRRAYRDRRAAALRHSATAGGEGAVAAAAAAAVAAAGGASPGSSLFKLPGVRALSKEQALLLKQQQPVQPDLLVSVGEGDEAEEVDDSSGRNRVPEAFTHDPSLPPSLAAGESTVTRNIVIAGIVWMLAVALLLFCSRAKGAKGGKRAVSGAVLPMHRPAEPPAAVPSSTPASLSAGAALFGKGAKQGGKSH